MSFVFDDVNSRANAPAPAKRGSTPHPVPLSRMGEGGFAGCKFNALSDSEHVAHGEQPRPPALRPECRGDRAARENLPVLGAMRQLQPLASAREKHGVVAHDASATQRRKADRSPRPLACVPVPAPDAVFRQRDVPALRRRLAQEQRGARGRIHLVLVMHFQNFDVEVRPKRPRGLLHERREQVHAEAHIAGLHNGGMARRRFDLGLVFGREPGRADDMDDARLRGQRRGLKACGGHGEIEHALDLREQRQRIGHDGHANMAHARDLARILADYGRARPLDRARDLAPFGFMHKADEFAPHPAARAHDR